MRDTDWEILSILYETRNITKTAEMMYMTQPTLTRRLQQIEEDLGAVLLTRSNKGVQFTAEGSFAALKAREIMQAISGVREGIALKEGGELKGTLRLGAPKSYLHSIVPKILGGFSEEYPEVTFEIHTDLSHELLRTLEARQLVMGPGIADWPKMASLKKNLLLQVAGSYKGSVTTDELIPSGEASSYRSNPEKISGFTMISRDPGYVKRAKKIREEAAAVNFEDGNGADAGVFTGMAAGKGDTTLGTIIVSDQIGDGSSREQAASCQKVLGGFANLAQEYSTKRYRSNCINWGLLPLRTEEELNIPLGSWIYIEDITGILENGEKQVCVMVLDSGLGKESTEHEVSGQRSTAQEMLQKIIEPGWAQKNAVRKIECTLDDLTEEERETLKAGCLINYYRG